MKNNTSITDSIQNKHTEIHYNEKYIHVKNKDIHIQLQGKITCPVLNSKVSSLVCSKLMDQEGWPRNCNPEICDSANCKIHKSIKKNIEHKHDTRKVTK